MKDMFDNEVNIGNTVIFHDTGDFRRWSCPDMFLVGEWKVRNIDIDGLTIVDGHLPNNSYYFWFPLNATEVVKDAYEIDSTYDISALF